jgi:DNA invertase Pin-like site-specific DNA recombinase
MNKLADKPKNKGILAIYCRTSIDRKESTSIEQQRDAGIEFATAHNFEYTVYADKGISGYKTDEDELNPFKNRPQFSALIDDIKSKKIDKMWVWEHSRISRNQYASAIIFNIFEKYNIELFEKDKKLELKDPQFRFHRQIMDAVMEFERGSIVGRTTRGLHKTINSGKRGYSEFYGYEKLGKDEKSHVLWASVESEITRVQFAYNEFLSGKSVRSIVTSIYGAVPDTATGTLIHKWVRILRHFGNTGFSLNTAGLKIYNSFKRCEIPSVRELADEKFYTASVNYPVQMVSIDDWVTTVEKLQNYKKIYVNRMRRTDTEIATGILSCPYCGLRYYVCKDKVYSYYKHSPNGKCKQTPKSFNVKKLNNLFEVFYFYYHLVYDDTKALIQENQKKIKIQLTEIKEKIKSAEKDNRKIERQMENIQAVLSKTMSEKVLELALTEKSELKIKREDNSIIIIQYKNELAELTETFKKDEMELTFYDVKQKVINFFEKLNTDDKRGALIKVIKSAQVFGKYIAINTGNNLFVFCTGETYELPPDVYNEFKTDILFKENFLNSNALLDENGDYSEDIKKLMDTPKEAAAIKYTEIQLLEIENKLLLHYIVRRMSGKITIKEYYIKQGKLKTMRNKFGKLGIEHDLKDINKVISFTGDI